LCRAVTSDVSAVSSCVANSTSPCNTFPPPSLEFRTSGFPCLQQAGPVRLQTGIQPRPSPLRMGLSARSAFTRPTPTYTWPKLLAQARVFPQHCWLVRNRALRSSGTPFTFANNTPVQRPLTDQRVGSPMGYVVPSGHRLLRPHPKLSPLPSIYLLLRWVFALQPCMGWDSPICSACLSLPCRLPYPGGPNGCLWLFLHRSY